MSNLDAERWRELSPHLDQALEMPETERAGWLAAMRLRDPALAADLQILLGEHGMVVRDGFLDRGLATLPAGFEPRGSDSPAPYESPRYTIGEEHARGGMGRILRATDTYLQRPVAIKELLRDDPQSEARFVREAKLTARLEHPSVVPVHDSGRWQASGKLFYSMKLVGGRTLNEVVAAAGSLPERLGLLSNVLAVADAIAYAHSRRIIHRDLKPANVLVGAYGETLVVDWGLAKDLHEKPDGEPAGAPERVESDPHPPSMTRMGTVLGTPVFMPPEQARGDEVDERADVYALGAMIYFASTGAPPYQGESSRSVLEQVLTQPPPELRSLEPAAPADLCAIVDKAMAREPDDRYPSAQELAADLRRFLTGQLVTAREYSWRHLLGRWARRHRAVATLTVLFAVAALAGTAAFVGREQRLRRQAEASRSHADAQSLALLIEHGRRELGLGRPFRAAIYLAEAYRQDPSNRPVRYLMTEAARPLGAHAHTLRGHTRDVVAAAFSHDGAQLATGSTDRTVRLWDTATGRAIRVLEGADSSIEDVALSPDGTLVASVEDVVCVWNARSGQLLQKLPKPGFRARFSPDGKWLAVGSMGGELRVWETATWKMQLEQRPHRQRVSAIAFHPDGKNAVTTSWDGVVAFWELPTWTLVRRLEDHGNAVSTAAFSADGRWLLTGDSDVTLHLREFPGWSPVHTIRLPEGSRWMSAFFSPDARTIVTTTFDGMIRVWHAASGTLLHSVDAIASGKMFDGAVAPDGLTVATVGLAGGDLWRLDAISGQRIARGVIHQSSVIYPAALSRDGSRLAASFELEAGGPSTLHVWDTRTGATLRAWQYLGTGYKLAATPDLGRIAIGGDRQNPSRLWDGATGQLIGLIDTGPTRVRALAASPDGTLFATAANQSPVRLWRADTGAPAGEPVAVGAVGTGLAFSPDDRHLAIAESDGRLRVVELGSRNTLFDVKAHPTWIERLEYSADGAWLVTAGRQDQTARVWNARTGKLRTVLSGHTDNMMTATFSPDGSLVATASVDNTARLWDAGTGELLRVIRGPSYTARFSPDGNELVTTGHGDYLVFWDVRLDPRGPEEILGLVERRSPWQLRGGRLTLR